PIKNADTPEGEDEAPDSPQSSKRMQSERAAAGLKQNGLTAPDSATLEIKPTTASEPADLRSVDLPADLAPDAELLL
ncbi:MAG: hypothetical protein AAGC72_11445, partial [Planctomycetota bacterium]